MTKKITTSAKPPRNDNKDYHVTNKFAPRNDRRDYHVTNKFAPRNDNKGHCEQKPIYFYPCHCEATK